MKSENQTNSATDPKKILIFSLAYLPQVGGAELAVKEITDRIDPREIEFHLICLRMQPTLAREERIGNVFVYRIGSGSSRFAKLWFQFSAAAAGAHLHRHHHFDGVWAIMAHSAGVPATLFNLFHTDVPYVLTLQEGDPPEYIERTMRPLWPLFVRAFKRAAMVQSISHFLGNWARRRGFEGPLEIIPNGVDTKRFAQEISLSARQALRAQHGTSDTDVALITSSRLVQKNGVDLVIRALAELPPAVKFLIAGDGAQHENLKLLAQELNVRDRVIFLGHLDHGALPGYLQAADIFIRASRSEGMGNSFIEAMAAGIPVVAPQVGGITDFLFDASRNPDREATGFAIEPESPASIAAVVQKIIDDPLRAHQIAIHAQQWVLKEYDWDKIAAAMYTRVFAKVWQ